MTLPSERFTELVGASNRWPSDAIADAFNIKVFDDGRRSNAALDLTVLEDGTALSVVRNRDEWPEPAWPDLVQSRLLIRDAGGTFSHIDGVRAVVGHDGERCLVTLDTYTPTLAVLDVHGRTLDVIARQSKGVVAARFVEGGVVALTCKGLTLWRRNTDSRWLPEAYLDVGGRKLNAAGEWLAVLEDDDWRLVRLVEHRFMSRRNWKLTFPMEGSFTPMTGTERLTWVGTPMGSHDEVAFEMAPWPEAPSPLDALAKHHKKMAKEARMGRGFKPIEDHAEVDTPLALAGPFWNLEPNGRVSHERDGQRHVLDLPPFVVADPHQPRLGPEARSGLLDFRWRHDFSASVCGQQAVVGHLDGLVYAVDLADGAATVLRWSHPSARRETPVDLGSRAGGAILLEDGRFVVAGELGMVAGRLDQELQTCLWWEHAQGSSVGVVDGELWVARVFAHSDPFASRNRKEINQATVARVDLDEPRGIGAKYVVPVLYPQFSRGGVVGSAGGRYSSPVPKP